MKFCLQEDTVIFISVYHALEPWLIESVFWIQVQNADDNLYGPGVEAAVVFIVQSGHVMVFNNEDGFTPANLRALCDVGNSTKAGSSTGYIGHKGIGFKSVFRV